MTTNPSVKITILMDNRAKPGFLSEHGFAVWIETNEHKILFDTGQSDGIFKNAARLNIDLATADFLVLSHGHYDHTGQVAELLKRNPQIQVLMHPKALQQRYSLHPNQEPKEISMPQKSIDALQALSAKNITFTDQPHQIYSWIGSSGFIPRVHPLEDTGGPFFMDLDGQTPDLIEDDLTLWIKTPRGLVILTGCCHAGLINTVEQIQAITGETSIYAIIGGLHLKHASEERLLATESALKNWKPDYLIPCHCTGELVIQRLQKLVGYRVKPGYSGMRFTINEQISILS